MVHCGKRWFLFQTRTLISGLFYFSTLFIDESPRWVPYTANNGVPPTAMKLSDWIGRVHHASGSVIPGKTMEHRLETDYRGNFYHTDVNQVEYLVAPSDLYRIVWEPGTPGKVPEGAVVGGHLDGPDPLYIIRVYAGGYIIPGYYDPINKCGKISFNGVQCRSTYEFLIFYRGW